MTRSRRALVVGASRGLGRGIAAALADHGAQVVGVARTPGDAPVAFEVADATDPAATDRLLGQHDPDVLVLVAGATPELRPLPEQTWETFSLNWHADVRIAFNWLRGALTRPLRPGSRVVVISSGAALQCSPLSGGYAGAKSTQRFLARYAQEESDRSGLGLTFTTLLPRLTPATELGRPAVEAYAARSRLDPAEYVARLGPQLTPAIAGAAVVRLLDEPATPAAEFLLTGDGLVSVG